MILFIPVSLLGFSNQVMHFFLPFASRAGLIGFFFFPPPLTINIYDRSLRGLWEYLWYAYACCSLFEADFAHPDVVTPFPTRLPIFLVFFFFHFPFLFPMSSKFSSLLFYLLLGPFWLITLSFTPFFSSTIVKF